MEQSKISPESPAVRAHLRMAQDIVRRMAESSRTCKNWCVGFVAGIAVLSSLMEPPGAVRAMVVPVPALMLLDAYYLAHERATREGYGRFLKQLHAGELKLTDLYEPGTNRGIPLGVLRALKSFSIYGFYGPMVLLGAALCAAAKTAG